MFVSIIHALLLLRVNIYKINKLFARLIAMRTSQNDRKSLLIHLFTKAVATTIVLFAFYYLNMLKPVQLGLSVASLSSSVFLVNAFVMFLIILIYDSIAARRRFLTQEIGGGLLSSLLIIILPFYLNLNIISAPLLFAALMIVLLFTLFVAVTNSALRKTVQFLIAIYFLLVLWHIASVNYKFNPSTLNISNSTKSLINTIANKTHNLVTYSVINNTWAEQFFENVSLIRGSPYYYCQNLSDFAKVRFNTMVTNYGISHYGYDQDFDRIYGTTYNTYIGEEVLYPRGYTPKAYISELETSAPLHWNALVNKTFVYYGYDIQNGPAYVIYGPNGGYSPCPTTEIPGPNINISQYFAQYGCTVATENETWFVIELSSSCP